MGTPVVANRTERWRGLLAAANAVLAATVVAVTHATLLRGNAPDPAEVPARLDPRALAVPAVRPARGDAAASGAAFDRPRPNPPAPPSVQPDEPAAAALDVVAVACATSGGDAFSVVVRRPGEDAQVALALGDRHGGLALAAVTRDAGAVLVTFQDGAGRRRVVKIEAER